MELVSIVGIIIVSHIFIFLLFWFIKDHKEQIQSVFKRDLGTDEENLIENQEIIDSVKTPLLPCKKTDSVKKPTPVKKPTLVTKKQEKLNSENFVDTGIQKSTFFRFSTSIKKSIYV